MLYHVHGDLGQAWSPSSCRHSKHQLATSTTPVDWKSSGSSWASVPRSRPTALFKESYEVQTRMVLAGSKDDQVAKVINKLLGKLMVGFVKAQSESFFGANDRILLCRPYAMVLQLAKAVLLEKRRRSSYKTFKGNTGETMKSCG